MYRKALWATAAVTGVVAVAATAFVAGHASSEGAEPYPAVAGCAAGSSPQIKPADIILTCADRGVELRNVTWQAWTTQRAVGVGVLDENDCQPDCANDTFQPYAVKITLTHSSGGTTPLFGHVDLSFIGVQPPAGQNLTHYQLPSLVG